MANAKKGTRRILAKIPRWQEGVNSIRVDENLEVAKHILPSSNSIPNKVKSTAPLEAVKGEGVHARLVGL